MEVAHAEIPREAVNCDQQRKPVGLLSVGAPFHTHAYTELQAQVGQPALQLLLSEWPKFILKPSVKGLRAPVSTFYLFKLRMQVCQDPPFPGWNFLP